MKILHSADWHLDSPLTGKTPEQVAFLKKELMALPDKIAALCKTEGCDLMFLGGDIFDGAYTQETYRAVFSALESVGIPVFIAPGNHDFCQAGSPYLRERWPENVHIFTSPEPELVSLPELECDIYGAGYTAMDCPPLLRNFQATGTAKWQLALIHGDPTQAASPYSPVTAQQVRASGLSYLALGHIHKAGSFRAGDTLCAWPGCPMGRGYDEPGAKGVLIVTLEDTVSAFFQPLNTLRFFDETVDVGESAEAAAASVLPPVPTTDFYRLTFTGYCAGLDLPAVGGAFPHIPNLELRDRTLPEIDLWSAVGEDSLEGVYFRLLHDAMDTDSETLQRRLKLAAKISRQILDGQEVNLP